MASIIVSAVMAGTMIEAERLLAMIPAMSKFLRIYMITNSQMTLSARKINR